MKDHSDKTIELSENVRAVTIPREQSLLVEITVEQILESVFGEGSEMDADLFNAFCKRFFENYNIDRFKEVEELSNDSGAVFVIGDFAGCLNEDAKKFLVLASAFVRD